MRRRRRRLDTPAYRDGVILGQLFTAEHCLLRLGRTRGLPEDADISKAIVAIGEAIAKARARVETKS